MKWDPSKVLFALASSAWPVLRTTFRPDCCIAASRVGVTVLQRFGIDGHGETVVAMAGNAAFRFWRDGGFKGEPPSGARVVEIDTTVERTPKTYPGHVVIVGRVQGKYFMLDLSAPQFDRPAKQIHVSEGIYALTDTRPGRLTLDLPGGGFIAYGAHPDPLLSFRDSPDWRPFLPIRQARYVAICRELIGIVERQA